MDLNIYKIVGFLFLAFAVFFIIPTRCMYVTYEHDYTRLSMEINEGSLEVHFPSNWTNEKGGLFRVDRSIYGNPHWAYVTFKPAHENISALNERALEVDSFLINDVPIKQGQFREKHLSKDKENKIMLIYQNINLPHHDFIISLKVRVCIQGECKVHEIKGEIEHSVTDEEWHHKFLDRIMSV